ncbi:striatin-interacting protein 1 homolog [Coccinella septempunctata]|uniref:striatin-interacting protein 1 homolog n=1 Tax=Coccinella septempunctata TaxID=41139 RepID=UPI001D0971E2|nr:striatin-interacting protein 1 homolog [Coccinella septempunctata]
MMSDYDFSENDYNFFTYIEVEDYLTDIYELMSYSELTNINAYSFKFDTLSEAKKESFIRKLMDQLESTDENIRLRASQSILFIALGCADSTNLSEKFNRHAAENTILLVRLGVFPLLVTLLHMERISTKYYEKLEIEKGTFTDSTQLRVILNILTLIVGQMLIEKKSKRHKKDVEIFIEDNLCSEDEDSLLFVLFNMMTEFASSEKPGYPIKKILLLILKILMVSFGDLKDLSLEKQAKRIRCGLNNDHFNDTQTYRSPLLHKVSRKDLEDYTHIMSLKYREINETVAAESINSLKKHLYIPLSELQVVDKACTRNEKIETFYENMLSKMKIYVQSLLQIFQSSLRSPVFNEYSDGNEETTINSTYAPLMIIGKFPMFEHMEIMNKAISGIFLLLLKHFKLNHIYQFEYLCQEMVLCNAISVFKTYVETTSDLFSILKKTRNQRNLSTCVNVLRIINKLIKGKYSTTKSFMKVNCKNLYSLATLNDKQLEVYSLKLLKILSKPLGRKWRQDNIKIMNKVFQTVRHRLLEDWNCGFQTNSDDEEMLKKQTEFFNARYAENDFEKEFEKDSEPSIELSDYFKRNYEKWLEVEVFRNPFDWDILLNT